MNRQSITLAARLFVTAVSYLGGVALGLAASAGLAETTYELRPNQQTPCHRQVAVTLEVSGALTLPDIKAKPDKDKKQLPMVRRSLAVKGKVTFAERVLSLDPAVQSVRQYEAPSASITIDDRAVPAKELAADRRLIVGIAEKNQLTLFAPASPLSRDELELIALPADPLALVSLLPSEPVKLQDRWELQPEALAMALGLDEVSSSTVECELKQVEKGRALVEFTGSLSGHVGGGKTEIKLAGRYTVDVASRLLNWAAISIQEKRELGVVGPGLDTAARVIVQIQPTEPSEALSNRALAGVSLKRSAMQQLRHVATGRDGQLEIHHDRRWHVVTDDQRNVSLRYVAGNDLLAQLNISLLDRRPAGTAQSMDEFQQNIRQVLGKSLVEIVRATEQENERGYKVYRVEAVGKANDLDMTWLYYYLVDPAGRSAALAFTLETQQMEAFAAADRAIIEQLILVDKPKATANENAMRPAGVDYPFSR